MWQLAADSIVDDFDFDKSSFCEHHKSPFPIACGTRAEELLELVHTDACGKVKVWSVGGAE